MDDNGQDKRQTCGINGKLCINGIRADFENDPLIQRPRPCHKWVRLVGKDPQSEKVFDDWCCNEWAKVKIGIENCQMVRQGTASTDKVANEIRDIGKENHVMFRQFQIGVGSGCRELGQNEMPLKMIPENTGE